MGFGFGRGGYEKSLIFWGIRGFFVVVYSPLVCEPLFCSRFLVVYSLCS